VPSPKRHTTSKSGGSGKSRKKETSGPAKSSSQTAPASFETIFGQPHHSSPELLRLNKLIDASRDRLTKLETAPRPTMALYRIRHAQRISRERKHLERLLQAHWSEKHAGTPPDGKNDTY